MNALTAIYFASAAAVAPCPAEPLPQPANVAPGAPSKWADPARVYEPQVSVTLDWLFMQALPSPEWAFGEGGAKFGMRWQVTPLLYSFATDPRLSRWRSFVVEPLVRQAGAIELWLSPEYLALDRGFAASVGARVGLRSYFGLIGRGDNLSISLGSSYVHFRDVDAVAYEVGAYVLFGMLGAVFEYSPSFEAASSLVSLRVRFF